MIKPKLVLAALTAVLLAVACSNNNRSDAVSRSVDGVANDEISNTTETGEPISINDLAVNDSNTDETSEPVAI